MLTGQDTSAIGLHILQVLAGALPIWSSKTWVFRKHCKALRALVVQAQFIAIINARGLQCLQCLSGALSAETFKGQWSSEFDPVWRLSWPGLVPLRVIMTLLSYAGTVLMDPTATQLCTAVHT